MLWKLLKVVKFGETVSYQQLAALAGSPKAARAVGGAMRSNPVSSGMRAAAWLLAVVGPGPLDLSDFPRQPKCARWEVRQRW